MGSITTPLDGETKYVGELITITYNSGALAFGGGAGEIASLQYTLNGVPKATKNMQPATAPATHSYTMAMPVNAGPAVIQVHARNINNLVLETVTVTLNLIAIPSATCAGSTNQALDGLTLNGSLAGIPAGGSARFRYGTVNGGPYPTNAPATPFAVGPTSAALTGLSAGTVYYYVLEVLDASATVVATSPQCSGQTLLGANQGGPACPVPPYVDDCPPKQVYSVGGTDYLSLLMCDTNGNQVIVVWEMCDGVPSGAPSYFNLNGTVAAPALPVHDCASGNEIVILCDNNAGTITRFLRRYVVLNGNVSTVDTTVDGQTAYAPAGTVQLCQPCGQIEVLCDDIGSFLRHYGCDGTTTDTALDGTTAYTVTGTVKRCDIKGATPIILCDDNGSFLRHLVYANDGLSATIYDTAFDGTTAYTAVGTVKRCDFAIAYQLLCDYSAGTVVPFLRRFAQAETGALVVTDTALDAVTAYTVAGTVGDCALANVDPVILCDDNGSFLRHVLYSGDGTTVTVFDTDMDGVDYTTVGTVKNCGASGRALIQACDKTTETTGNVPGACGTNQQTVDAVDIQDAEEKDVASGLEVNVNDNDLEMAGTAEAGESDHQIAVRFTMNVPQGATICNAYIQFTSRSTTSFGTLDATISAEAEDDSAPFVENNGELSARTKTAANVAWSVPLWPTSSQAGADQRTPDLSTIVQEIVDRPGWAAGNNTAFFFVPGATGYRRAQSITSGTAVAPKLHVEYVLDSPGGTKDVCVPFYKEIDLSTGLETGNSYRINETSGAWEAYTPTGTVTDGNCLSCTVQRSSTIQRQVGAGTVTVASGARSLSIVVLSGQPTVSIGAGAAVALATGISLNWGASSDKEVLTDAFSFTCAAGDDLIVTTIR